MSKNPDDNPNHPAWQQIAKAFQHLTEGMHLLESCKSMAIDAGSDTRERIDEAFNDAHAACLKIRPLVDDDELEEQHEST